MTKYFKAVNDLDVYSSYLSPAEIIKTIRAGEVFPYNREKRRRGINWIEIYLVNGEKAYIVKNKFDVGFCPFVELDDDEVEGFHYEIKNRQKDWFYDLFSPVSNTTEDDSWMRGKIKITAKRKYKDEAAETTSFEYDPDVVAVKPFRLLKKDRFYVTLKDNKNSKQFVEINNFKGISGIIPYKTKYTETNEKWMKPVIAIVMLLAILLSVGLMATGHFFMGLLLLVPFIIAAFIALLVLRLVQMIAGGIFNEIRKRC